jgi:hypothetical protein
MIVAAAIHSLILSTARFAFYHHPSLAESLHSIIEKYHSNAGIFVNSGMLAARLAIAEEMTAPGPRRTKNSRDDVAMPPLLPRRKSSRRTVSEGINLAATMQSSSPAGLHVNITNGSLMTRRRSSPLSRPGGTDGSSPSGSLLVSSGADSVTAASFAAAFAAEFDDDDDDIGLVIAESPSTINLDAPSLTRR